MEQKTNRMPDSTDTHLCLNLKYLIDRKNA